MHEPGASGEGPTRTDIHCHSCTNTFIAQLDFSIDGNHVIECPYCQHEHFRVIKAGHITDDRWDPKEQRIDVEARCVWKSNVLRVQMSSVSAFLRDSWLNRSDL